MKINTKILKWYDIEKRDLPWRNRIKGNVNPYLIWISEIMLQQTTVNAVIPYYKKFIKVYPNIFKLANSSLEDVLFLWAGLGYYARARNLYKCSQIISKNYNGILVTRDHKILLDIAKNKGPKKSLVVLGYAGWGEGQLEGEMEMDHWLLSELDFDIIFQEKSTNRWLKAYENSFIRM